MKKLIIIAIVVMMFSIIAIPSLLFADPPEKTSAFVCPVITSDAVGEHNPKAVPLGASGTYTVTPPTSANGGNLMVPIIATNGDGSGIPGGPQSQPGDTDYTAIWATQ